MRTRLVKTVLAVGILAAIAALVAVLVATGRAPERQSRTAPVVGGAFELVDGRGRTVRDGDYRGRHLMVFFGYTHCPDICPSALVTIAEAFDRLDADARDRVRAIFVSVDPDRDTPERLGDFARSFHANIDGLTGSRAQIDAVVGAYKATYRIRRGDDPEYYPVDHSSIIYLMDGDGRFVTHFSHRTEVDKMLSVLKSELAR